MPTYIDQLNRSIEINPSPKRIVSLVPSITELLHFLGCDSEVVGITKFCEFPSQWRKEKTIVGGTKNLRIEEIEKLNPDLIIANKEENDKELVESLEKAFPVWVSDVKDYSDGLKMIESLSIILNKKSIGQQLITDIKIAKEALNIQSSGKMPTVAYVIWKDPIMVAGGDTFISSMITLTGASNVFTKQKRYPQISAETLLQAKPDYILLSSEPFPFKEKDFPLFENICPTAVIKLVDGTYFSWYGSRMLPAMQYFHNFREEITTDA